jgi:lysophospholipase L1-like esterase
MRLIAVGGESTAFGYYDEENRNGWAGRLQSRAMHLTQATPLDPAIVRNYALPGRTIVSVARELIPELSRLKRLGDVAAILSIGMNEAKIHQGQTRPLVALDAFGAHLIRYAEDTARLAVPTIYVGLCAVDETRTSPAPSGATIEDDLVEEYDAVLEDLAVSTGMPYVPTRSLQVARGLEATLSPDGCHPNAYGHELIEAAVCNELVTLQMLPR